jgi:Ala-tRNA(Pro) deacylase
MSDYVLEKGRPEDTAGRLPKEVRCYDLLDSLGIEYYRVDHRSEPADTMEACDRIDAILNAVIVKNLFLCNRQQTKYYLLMMPGEKVFKTRELSHQIGSARLSFGTPERMEEYLDITPGSVSVLGLMNDTDNHVQLLIDRDILSGEYFGLHPCINTSSMKMKIDDLLHVFLPAVHHEPIFVELKGEEQVPENRQVKDHT